MNEDEPNQIFTCPITNDIFTDPVIAEDGRTYERAAITDWLKKNSISPISRLEIKVENLKPNLIIKAMMDQFSNFDNEAKNTKKRNSEFLGKFSNEINKLEENNQFQKQYNKMFTHVNISAFTCPLTNNIFSEPVLASDGYTYEKKAIQDWFVKSDISSKTNQKFVNKNLVSNHATKGMIDLLIQQEKDWKNIKQTENNYLYVFAPKVRELLHLDLMNLQTNAAIKLLTSWQGSLNIQKQKDQIIKKETQLNAYKLKDQRFRFQIPNSIQSFVGREKQMDMINAIFEKHNALCIVGSCGMGKSQLAAEYIKRSKFSSVIWLHGQNKFLIFQIQTYLQKAHDQYTKNMDNLKILLQKLYDSLGKNALVVIDNVQNQELLNDYVPEQSQIKVIITSRCKGWKIPIIEISQFSEDQTLKYILSMLQDNQKIISVQELKSIHNLLGGIPLAISHALVTLKRDKQLSIQKYCEQFTKNYTKQFEKNNDDQFNFVYTALILAIHDVKKQNNQIDLVMNVIGYMAPEQLDKELTFQFLQLQDKKGFSKNKSKKLKQAFRVLCDFSIISQNQSNQNFYYINRLTQYVIRMIQRKTGIFQTGFNKFAEWIHLNLYYDQRSMQDIKRVNKFIPHGLAISNIQCTDFYTNKGLLLHQVGHHQFYSIKNYLQAKICLQNALKVTQMNPSEDKEPLARLLNDLGCVNSKLGNYHQQLSILTKALDISEKYIGKNSIKTAQVLNNLGDAYGLLGNYKEQMNVLLRALQIQEKYLNLDKDHISISRTLSHLGTAYGNLGDYKKKKQVLTRSLAISEKHYGKNHSQNGVIITNLANANRAFGEGKQAIKGLLNALKNAEKHFDEDHLDYGLAALNLGIGYIEIGDYQPALNYLQISLKIHEKHFGLTSPNTARVYLGLSKAHKCIQNYQKAKQFTNKANTININYYGPNHPSILDVELNINGNGQNKQLLNFLQDFTQGLAKEKSEKIATDQNVLHQQSSMNHLQNIFNRDDYEIQLSVKNSTKFLDENNSEQQLLIQYSKLFIQGQKYVKLNKFKEAKTKLEEAILLAYILYGKDDQNLAGIMIYLGGVYNQLDQYQQAFNILSRALIINYTNFGKNDYRTAQALTNLGAAYSGLGDEIKNKQVTKKAYDIFLKMFGPKHKFTQDALYNLKLVERKLSKPQIMVRPKIMEKPKIRDKLINPTKFSQYQKKDIGKNLKLKFGDEFVAFYGLQNAFQLDQQQFEVDYEALEKGENHPRTLQQVVRLAAIYQDLKLYDMGVKYYTRALSISEKINGKNHPYTNGLTQYLYKIKMCNQILKKAATSNTWCIIY